MWVASLSASTACAQTSSHSYLGQHASPLTPWRTRAALPEICHRDWSSSLLISRAFSRLQILLPAKLEASRHPSRRKRVYWPQLTGLGPSSTGWTIPWLSVSLQSVSRKDPNNWSWLQSHPVAARRIFSPLLHCAAVLACLILASEGLSAVVKGMDLLCDTCPDQSTVGRFA